MPSKDLVVGTDFDNTIVCYDAIFHRVASERGWIPAGISKNKESVRDYLRQTGKEDLWTELQGYVYGARMADVTAFPGALECITKLRANGVPVHIISHKTRRPYKGEAYDLHAAARGWLEAHGLAGPGPLKGVFFMETKQEKLARIGACGCTHFIDDLPEFFAEPDFPKGTRKMLFSPSWKEGASLDPGVRLFQSWREIASFLMVL